MDNHAWSYERAGSLSCRLAAALRSADLPRGRQGCGVVSEQPVGHDLHPRHLASWVHLGATQRRQSVRISLPPCASPWGQHEPRRTAGENPWELELTARDVLAMATVEGARALGQEDRTGSLVPGKQADVILVDATHISMIPLIDPVTARVRHASRSTVTDVFVAGRRLKRGGQLVDVNLARYPTFRTRGGSGSHGTLGRGQQLETRIGALMHPGHTGSTSH
jgi:hypothetical protein